MGRAVRRGARYGELSARQRFEIGALRAPIAFQTRTPPRRDVISFMSHLRL
jgi:hypothetical protein